MTRIVLTLSIFLLSELFCHAQENYLVFGKGGGFSGQATAYKLLENGKVLKGSGLGEINYTEYSKLKRSKARKTFSLLNKLNTEAFSQPGNMYYFITWYHETNKTNYSWGASGFDPPDAIGSLYRETMSVLTKLKYKPLQD